MRQIPLKTLRASLTEELKELPFEITSYGHVLAVVSAKGLNDDGKGLNNSGDTPENNPKKMQTAQSKHNDECEQPSEKTTNKKRFKPKKATIPAGGSYFNPQPKRNKK